MNLEKERVAANLEGATGFTVAEQSVADVDSGQPKYKYPADRCINCGTALSRYNSCFLCNLCGRRLITAGLTNMLFRRPQIGSYSKNMATAMKNYNKKRTESVKKLLDIKIFQ